MEYSDMVAFHGHSCPGLAIGYRMSIAAMAELGLKRAGDEEVVAVVENDACGVDALQYITGCTFGKGNLIFRDYGKNVYTLYARRTGKGVRVVFHGKGVPDALRGDRVEYAEFLKHCPQDEIIDFRFVDVGMPAIARVRSSVVCERCHELVMETRVQQNNEKILCIPCAEQHNSTQDI